MIHPDQIKWRLEKSLRRFPDAQITDKKPIGAPDAFLAEIKRGRKSTIFALSAQEMKASSEALDSLVAERLTMTMLR